MTAVPWFRYGLRQTRRWLRRCRQRARVERTWASREDAALASDAYERCVGKRRERAGKDDAAVLERGDDV